MRTSIASLNALCITINELQNFRNQIRSVLVESDAPRIKQADSPVIEFPLRARAID